MKATLHDAVGNASPRVVKRVKAFLTLSVLGGSLFFVGGSLLLPAGGANAQSPGLPDGPGKALAAENCSACHGLELVTAQRRSPEEWKEVVNRMISNGDTLTEEQYNEVVTYLGTYLGKEPASSATAGKASGGGSALGG